MAETHSEFYTADIGGVQVWRVVSHTARTWTVERTLLYGRPWRRLVKMADIGSRYHITPLAALAHVARGEREEIRLLKDRLQRKRTALGMVESEMRKLPGGAELVRLESALSAGAVDPADGVVEGGPRAPDRRSSSSVGSPRVQG